jgi:hypothetical protein
MTEWDIGYTSTLPADSILAETRNETPAIFTAVALEDFAQVDEPGAIELVGEPGQALIPAAANTMLYGDGGAGKTTLSIDLAFHLAAGQNWLGIHVRGPARILIIEDEGPRAFFRKKIAQKLQKWAGKPLQGRAQIIEEPWAQFTFNDDQHRHQLAHLIDTGETDLVIVGPVVVAGMEAAGTLQDVRQFTSLVDQVRQHTASRTVTFLLIHHENKGGTVSGAWEGAGDTLIHLSAQGHGQTRMFIQKARHAPDYHQKTLQLAWADGESYTVEEEDELSDDAIEAKILAAVAFNPGIAWTAVEEKAKPSKAERRRDIRNRLLADGTIVNIGREDGREIALAYVQGRGKTTRLHLGDDPTIQYLLPARKHAEEPF